VQAGRFPVLDAAQLELLRSYGTEQEVAAAEALFAEGDETYDLIVVLEGEVQMIGYPGRSEEALIVTYGPGHTQENRPSNLQPAISNTLNNVTKSL
jgi:CRP-like cAMP-binding protein